ncbi:MAG: hypothetical protein GC137_10845 [Alphaproteobacteria bacterium]|nr:hypothetical protein [Alphaproteobacteria bacterium]
MGQKEEILKQEAIASEDSEKTFAEKIKEQKKKDNKKRNRRIIWGLVAAFFAWVGWYLFKPYKASADYGICKSFLELFLPYPHTLYVGEILYQRDGSMRLWYTHIDGFGEHRLEPFDCKLTVNPETGRQELVSLKLNKVFVPQDEIIALNNALPYFWENPVILTWPAPLPNSIQDLQFDFNAVRRFRIDTVKQ